MLGLIIAMMTPISSRSLIETRLCIKLKFSVSLRSAMKSLSLLGTPVLRCSIKLPLHSSVEILPLRKLDTVSISRMKLELLSDLLKVVVYAKNNRGSEDRFSSKKKHRRKKNSPHQDDLVSELVLKRKSLNIWYF